MPVDHGTEAVSAALQRYAARGVFRGFSILPDRNGRRHFRFTWLTRQPITITYHAKSHRLDFRSLLPGVGRYPGLGARLKDMLDDHTTGAVPAHRRIDRRRARVTCAIRRGAFSLALDVRGRHEAYAVQRGLNLVNQLFLLLHADYPEYLVECFGFRPE
ncbi:MAG: hypothetical protein HY048_12305 [Acidobacteria bacterium]|nr:hypothetical protein [Acidobacteriota bacterium]